MEGGVKKSINVLPGSYQRHLIARRRAMQWGAALAVGLVFSGLLRLSDARHVAELSHQLDMLTRENEPTQQMLKQLVAMRAELDELQHLEVVAQELEFQRPALYLLGLLSQIGEQTGGRLRITKLELSGLQESDPARKKDTAGAPGPGVLITGLSLDNQSIAKLQSGLAESGFFSRVELVKSTELDEDNGALREYQVRCEL
jgi:Tfp pilus assembly protein PilN